MMPGPFHGNWHMTLWSGCSPGAFQSEGGRQAPFPRGPRGCEYMRAKLPESLSSTPGISQAKKIKLVHREKWRSRKKSPEGIWVLITGKFMNPPLTLIWSELD